MASLSADPCSGLFCRALQVLYLPGITSLLVSTIAMTVMLYFSDHLPRYRYSTYPMAFLVIMVMDGRMRLPFSNIQLSCCRSFSYSLCSLLSWRLSLWICQLSAVQACTAQEAITHVQVQQGIAAREKGSLKTALGVRSK